MMIRIITFSLLFLSLLISTTAIMTLDINSLSAPMYKKSSTTLQSIGRFITRSFIPYLIFFGFNPISKVASGSMKPTLYTHDFVYMAPYNLNIASVTNTMTLGIFSPLIDYYAFRFPIFRRPLIKFRNIERGDIIVFRTPRSPEMAYTKRIIGMPGDLIEMQYGQIFINGKPITMVYKGLVSIEENNYIYRGEKYSEKLDNRPFYNVMYTNGIGSEQDKTIEFRVPEGKYLCFGDNRNNSADARSLLNYVSHREIEYQVVMRIISNGNLTSLQLIRFIKSIRLNEMMKILN